MDRPLSKLEQAVWIVDQVVSQNFVIVAHIYGEIQETLLKEALAIVQKKYPPLCCRIKPGMPPEFLSQGVGPIQVRVVNQREKSHWIEETESELEINLPWTEGPLVRLVLLTQQDSHEFVLLITFCHIISDATAGIKFLENLLTILNKMAQGVSIEPLPPLPILPSSIDLLKKDLKYRPTLLDKFDRLIYRFSKSFELKGDHVIPPEQQKTRIIQRIFSPSEVKTLAKRSKEENTSVHGALCASMLQAAVERIRKTQGIEKKGPLLIGCMTPVNIRHQFSRPIGEEMGNFISDSLHYQKIDDNASLWSEARKVKQAIQKSLEKKEDIRAILNVGDLLTEELKPQDMVRIINQTFPPLSITNLGKLDIAEQFGKFSLEQLHFVSGISPSAKSGFGMAVTTFREFMTLNFQYLDPFWSRESALALVENVTIRLKEVLMPK